MNDILLLISSCIHIRTYDIDEVIDHVYIAMEGSKMNRCVATVCLKVCPLLDSANLPSGLISVPSVLVDYFHRKEIIFQSAESQQ